MDAEEGEHPRAVLSSLHFVGETRNQGESRGTELSTQEPTSTVTKEGEIEFRSVDSKIVTEK